MLRKYLFALLAVTSLFFSSAALALPFNIVTKAGTELPTQVQLGSTTTAYYTVTNNNDNQRNGNYVKHLPPFVNQVTSGGTFPNTCGPTFNLGPHGSAADSCTLQLTISGPVDPNAVPDMHLFVCFPGGITCAGTPNPLNIVQTFPISIAITPVTASIDTQNTQQYTAIGTFAGGLTINVTSLLNWSSSNKAVATISSSGLATGTFGSGGTTTISASINGVTSNLASLTVAGELILTSTPSINTEVGAAYSQANVASGAFTPYTYSVSAGTLPNGTLLNAATGLVSGTPTVAGTFNYTIKVTDPLGKTATSSTSVTIAAAVTIVGTPSIPTQVGLPYSQTNVANNGVLPYVFSVSAGALPGGTTLNTATGTVSGTPTTAGAFSYTIRVTDSNGRSATAATTGNMTAMLALTATVSTDTEVGAPYSQLNTVSGGTAPYTYAITAGSIPTGTTFSTTTGTVSGTPTAPGAFAYTVQVTDNLGATASASTSGTIAVTVTMAATPSAQTEVGVPYSQTNVASNGLTPYIYSVSGGTLPGGTTLNTTTGTVSGTPTTAGTFAYTIRVTDHDGQIATAVTSGTIAATVTLVATPSPTLEVGGSYSQINTVSGGTAPYTYSISAGSIPTGTALNTATGTVSGTPVAPGAFSYTVQVTDSDGVSATATTTGTIAAGLAIAATPSTFNQVGVTYSQLNTVSGGSTPYTYTVSAGAIPAGTTLSTVNGSVSGSPTTAGAFSYTITVTDGAGLTASAPTSGTIAPVLGLTATPSTNTEVNATYSQPNTVSGGTAPYAYSISAGAVPAGTSLSATNGTVSGTPTTAGAFSYTVLVTDSGGGTATAQTMGTIAASVTLVATPSTFTEVGANYSQTNVASGGTQPYVYSVSAGALPAGTTLNTSTGTVSGVPTFGGAFSYTIAVTDFDGITATAVTSGTMTGGVALVATASTDTVVGRAYTQTNVANGGTAPYTYSVSVGAVPAGTTLNTASGTVSGTPTTAGPISYTITATDHNGATATAATSGTMAAMISLAATPSANTGVGAAYSQLNTVGGGKSPFTYNVTVGAVPAGTTLGTTTGTVAGTPTTSGPFSYTVQVTDADGFTATAQTTGTIATAVTLTATPSASTEVGTTYSQTNVAGGGVSPYTYALSAGTLPNGTTLSATSGTVSGTPTVSGAFSYTIKATDSDGGSATAVTSGTIASGVVLLATPSTNNEVNVMYSQLNTASGGGTPYVFSVSAGTIPAGTSLNTASGTVSGLPSAGGNYNYTIKVTDSSGATATATSSGTITALALTASASPNTEIGAPYSQANTVSGGGAPYTYAVLSGALPGGTTLTSNGTVSGTPNVTGPFTYTIQVTDKLLATATATTNVTIASAVSLAATPSANTRVAVAYSQMNVASNGVAPYTYSVSAGALPAGTTLDSTGTVSGTPTTAGVFSYTIKVTDNDSITATAATSGTMAVMLKLDSASDKDVDGDNKPQGGKNSAVEYIFNGTKGDTVNHLRYCLATDDSCNSCSNAEDIVTSIDVGTPYRINSDTLTNYLMKNTSVLNPPLKADSTYYIGVYASSIGSNCATPDGATAYCGTSNTGLKTQKHMCITANSKTGATISSVSSNGKEVYLTKPAQYVYASNLAANNILQCVPNSDGSFSNCSSIASVISPYGAALTNVNGTQYAYVTAGDGNVYQCLLSNDGANSFDCNILQHGGVMPLSPQAIAFLTLDNSQYVYLGNASGSVYKCPVGNDGTFGVCAGTVMNNGSNVIAFHAVNKKQYIYGVNGIGTIEKCSVNTSDGTLSDCAIQTGPAGTPTSLVFEAINGSPLVYVTSNSSAGNFVYYAKLGVDGSFAAWASNNNAISASSLVGISFATVNKNLYANVSAQNGTVYQCAVNQSSGDLTSCGLSSKISATLSSSVVSGFALAHSHGKN
jgi:hypothetical protein